MGKRRKISGSNLGKGISGNMLARNAGSSSRIIYVNNEPETLPNPRPNNYTIIDYMEFRGNGALFLLVNIKYHDCTNYEGVKILVFEDCSYEQLMQQKLIDPHFSDDKRFHSPIARFEPSEQGMNRAAFFIDCLINNISNV